MQAAQNKVTPASKPTDAEILAKALDDMAINIQKISQGFEILGKSKVNRRFLHALLKPMTGMTYTDIDKVLDALPLMAKEYTK